MPASRPTAEGHEAVVHIALSGLAAATELGDIAVQLAPLHPKHNMLGLRDSVG